MATHIYEEMLAVSGLAPLLAADVIARACAREGVKAEAITRAELATTLPVIEKGLKLYLTPAALKVSMQRLRAIAAGPNGRNR